MSLGGVMMTGCRICSAPSLQCPSPMLLPGPLAHVYTVTQIFQLLEAPRIGTHSHTHQSKKYSREADFFAPSGSLQADSDSGTFKKVCQPRLFHHGHASSLPIRWQRRVRVRKQVVAVAA